MRMKRQIFFSVEISTTHWLGVRIKGSLGDHTLDHWGTAEIPEVEGRRDPLAEGVRDPLVSGPADACSDRQSRPSSCLSLSFLLWKCWNSGSPPTPLPDLRSLPEMCLNLKFSWTTTEHVYPYIPYRLRDEKP